MTATHTPSHLIISDIVNGQRKQMKFDGYTEEEAKSIFAKAHNLPYVSRQANASVKITLKNGQSISTQADSHTQGLKNLCKRHSITVKEINSIRFN